MGKKSWLVKARALWATVANAALAAAGQVSNLDHRSNANRGLPTAPAVHLGPSAAHLLRKQRPSPRVQRHALAQEQKRTVERLLDDLEHSRARLAVLEDQAAWQDQMLRNQQQDDERELISLLADHRLAASDARQLKEVASLLVLDAARDNMQVLYDAARSQSYRHLVAESLDPKWQSIQTPAGLFLLQPHRDDVVLVGPGYVVSDTTQIDAVETVLQVAALLPYKEPVVVAAQAIVANVETTMLGLGKEWAVRSIKSAVSKLKARKPF